MQYLSYEENFVKIISLLAKTNCLVPTDKMGESFKYLGKFFDFEMSDKEHKSELISLADELMYDNY